MIDQGTVVATTKGPWNSLEIVKLVTSATTPILLAMVGYLAWSIQQSFVERREVQLQTERRAKEFEIKAEENLRGLRVNVYMKAAPLFREILAYHFHVGSWKELSPANVIAKKRKLDSLIYSQRAILSPDFAQLYHNYMREAFVSAGNSQGESRLRSSTNCRPISPLRNDARWRAWFTGEDNRLALCTAYKNLQKNWSSELSLPIKQDDPKRECPPLYNFVDCS